MYPWMTLSIVLIFSGAAAGWLHADAFIQEWIDNALNGTAAHVERESFSIGSSWTLDRGCIQEHDEQLCMEVGMKTGMQFPVRFRLRRMEKQSVSGGEIINQMTRASPLRSEDDYNDEEFNDLDFDSQVQTQQQPGLRVKREDDTSGGTTTDSDETTKRRVKFITRVFTRLFVQKINQVIGEKEDDSPELTTSYEKTTTDSDETTTDRGRFVTLVITRILRMKLIEKAGETTIETDATPSESDATPSESDATPSESDATPGERDPTPGESDATPGESDSTPGESDATPGGSDDATTGSEENQEDCLQDRAKKSKWWKTKSKEDWNLSQVDWYLKCKLPKPKKTAEALCKLMPGKIVCHLYCIYGHTFEEGITRRTVCSFDTGQWSKTFDECKPFVDCSLKLRKEGYFKCLTNKLREGPQCAIHCHQGQYQQHRCDIEGGWNPPLPTCVTKEDIATVDPPKKSKHDGLKYPECIC